MIKGHHVMVPHNKKSIPLGLLYGGMIISLMAIEYHIG
jgi:hypothetical protein